MTRSTRYSKTPPLPLLFLPLPVLHTSGGPFPPVPQPPSPARSPPPSAAEGGRENRVLTAAPWDSPSPLRCSGEHSAPQPAQGEGPGCTATTSRPGVERCLWARSQRRDPPHHRDTPSRGLHSSQEPAVTGTPPSRGPTVTAPPPTPGAPPSSRGPPFTVTHFSSRVSPITGTPLSPPSAASPGRK